MITRHETYPELAKELGVDSLLFKREDLHPYGSHKGRSIPVMIDTYINGGIKHFVISSSGNSALAAALHVQKINRNKIGDEKIMLEILVGKKITSHKLKKLEALRDQHILLSIQERPLQALFVKTQDPEIKGLRQSSDDTALIGYHSLAEELLEISNLKAVFVGTSSGTTAQALAEYFIKNKKEVEVHIVQTSTCHPMADVFLSQSGDEGYDEKSLADAIVDHTANRKDTLIPLVNSTSGSGWIAKNEQILIAQELAKKHANLSISTNSALSIAGLMEASYTGRTWEGSVVCLICGE